jgi:hypothetical protein
MDTRIIFCRRMLRSGLFLLLAVMAPLLAQAQAPEPKTYPNYTVVVDAGQWPYSTRDKHFHLWTPQATPVLKGLLVFAFHGGEKGFAEDARLRALAAELGCGVVGFDKFYMFPGHDVPASVLTDALTELATVAARPEVAHAPILTFGHSNATNFAAGFAAQAPERVFAWIAFKSAFGAQFARPAIYRIPGLVMSGEGDESYFSDQLATVRRLRRQHRALVQIIVEPDGHHGLDPAAYGILLEFMKTAFHLRVPVDADPRKGPVRLLDVQEAQGWLGQTLDGVRVKPSLQTPRAWEEPVNTRRQLEIAPYAEYPGDTGMASWLPTGEYARAWQAFCMDAAYFRQTENIGLAVLPAPGPVQIDGQMADWDLTGGVFICGDVLQARDKAAAWCHAMYDDAKLYLLLRFTDPTPMNHQGRVADKAIWQGDCVQLRMATHPGDKERELQIWIDAAYLPRDRQDIVAINYPRRDPPARARDAHQAQQAFSATADARGYRQEIAIPWDRLLKDGAPRPGVGEAFRLCVEPQFTIGTTLNRLQLVDVFMANEKPRRSFTWEHPQSWGQATLKAAGPHAPRPVRLADGREFPVAMNQGVPVIDWTGVETNAHTAGGPTAVTPAEWRRDLAGRFAQARRLEASDPPAAAAAYAALADTPLAKQAAARLGDAELRARCAARALLQRMWVAEMALRDVRSVGEVSKDFHATNAEALAEIRAAATLLLAQHPNTADAKTARLMLARYKLSEPAPAEAR